MLNVAAQRRFVQIAAMSPPERSARSIAKEAGFSPNYAYRLMRRHREEIEKRRAKIARLGRQPRYAPGRGEQLRLLEEGRDPHLIEPEFAERWWRQRRADLDDVELRWRSPSEMDRLKAQRALRKARAAFDAATRAAVAVFVAHSKQPPSDMLASAASRHGGRAEGATSPTQTAAADAAEAREGASAAPTEPHPLAPRRCPRCLSLKLPEPRYGLLGGGRGFGIIGTRLTCDCAADGTRYATERARQLAVTWSSMRVLAETGGGYRPSPFAPRTYGNNWDPLALDLL